MAKPTAKKPETEPIQLDLSARRRLWEIIGGNRINNCYQCGACTGDCPSARFSDDFNPREIMLTALLGNFDNLLAADSPIWNCSNCYNCYERCPQDVRPVEVIIALKNMVQKTEARPESVSAVYNSIITTGRSAPVLDSLDRRRERMGLPPLPPLDMNEINKILAPDEDGANTWGDSEVKEEDQP